MSAPTSSHGGVLIVEDDDDARQMMRDVVELGGCTAMLAANGVEALQVLATRRPCLIVIDLTMPVMNGATLIEELRRQPALAQIPFIVTTAATDRAPSGAPVLTKPIDIKAVWAWMQRTCHCATATAMSSS